MFSKGPINGGNRRPRLVFAIVVWYGILWVYLYLYLFKDEKFKGIRSTVVATRDYGVPLLLQRLSDPHLIEGARRLRQDAAVEGGASHEHSMRLDQNDALQMRTRAHLDKSGDLPEDILRQRTTLENHLGVRGLHKVPSRLYDEDVSGGAGEMDVRANADICAEGVDSCRQWSGCAAKGATEVTASKSDETSGGVGVGCLFSVDNYPCGCFLKRRGELETIIREDI
jgi:hypothetical protein